MYVGQGWEFAQFLRQIARFVCATGARRSFIKKSDLAKSEGSNLLLGIKRGKAVKNCQKPLCKERFAQSRSFKKATRAIAHGCSR